MKKVLLLMAILALVSGVASANSFFETCSGFGTTVPYTGAGQSGGPFTSTCAALTLPVGDTINSVEVYYLADFQFGQTTANTVSTTETAAGSWAAPNTGTPYICVTTGGGSSNAGPCTYNGTVSAQTEYSTATAGLGTNTFAAFNVTITTQEGVSSFVSGSSYGNIVEFDYSPPPSGTPEPMSMALTGGGLLALGLLAGKRRKKA